MDQEAHVPDRQQQVQGQGPRARALPHGARAARVRRGEEDADGDAAAARLLRAEEAARGGAAAGGGGGAQLRAPHVRAVQRQRPQALVRVTLRQTIHSEQKSPQQVHN